MIIKEKDLDILLRSPLFEGLSLQQLESALNCLDIRSVHKEKGEYFLQAGDITQSMGLMLRGDALIIQEDIWGYRNIMAIIGPGDSFAEPFAASGQIPMNISVLADCECDAVFLQIGQLLTVCPSACSHHSQIIRNLVKIMARKILQFNDKITHVSKRNTREKLLSYLSSEAQRQGSLCFTIPYDRQQLADYLCVERSAMSVVLSQLQKEKLIRCNKNHFELNPGSSQT